ncbi:GYDIA family GHMP kinase [Bizionia sp. KMM 8389]
MTQFYSNGKLLLTGEYVVLDGAKALAVPTKYGQYLTIETTSSNHIVWTSLDEQSAIWFETDLEISNEGISSQKKDCPVTKRLIQIFNAVEKLKPGFIKPGLKLTSKLTFPRNWGLGSSSTLLNNIATWAEINPYTLLEATFGGSGYDIACASNNTAITYSLENQVSLVNPVTFNPIFKDKLYFIYLNKKQDSREGIATYRNTVKNNLSAISEINQITDAIVSCKELSNFNSLLASHETIIADLTKQTPVKTRLFSDYTGAIKSLGAWGGDFILASATENTIPYFKEKGYNTILKYEDIIL